MSKNCPVCESRRGKRKCPLYRVICSQCCGKVREEGHCPATCHFMVKSQQFDADKELMRSTAELTDKLAYYEKNRGRLDLVLIKLQENFSDIQLRDDYYHDKIFVEGLRNAQEYFRASPNENEQNVQLNRVGVIENIVRDVIINYRLEKRSLTDKDVDALLEAEIYSIMQFLKEGDGKTYCNAIKDFFWKQSRQERSESLIIH